MERRTAQTIHHDEGVVDGFLCSCQRQLRLIFASVCVPRYFFYLYRSNTVFNARVLEA
jgi:hypothetical protein